MKYILIGFMSIGFFLNCGADDGESCFEDFDCASEICFEQICYDIFPTNYQIKNEASFAIPNLTSYYYDVNEIFDFVQHGYLNPGELTDQILTTRNYINIGMSSGGETCLVFTNLVSTEFFITDNHTNIFIINGSTKVYCS